MISATEMRQLIDAAYDEYSAGDQLESPAAHCARYLAKQLNARTNLDDAAERARAAYFGSSLVHSRISEWSKERWREVARAVLA